MSEASTNPPADNSQELIVRGVIDRVIFRNADNGYAVVRLRPEKGEEIIVTGNFMQAGVGAHIIARGQFSDHPKYGSQFKAHAVTETTPSSAEGIERYLSSGLIKGIGKKTAERIVSEFGAKTFEILEKDPDQIARLSGVGQKKAQLLLDVMKEQQNQNEIKRFLVENQISPNLAQRIYNEYGDKSVEMISKNPYQLASDLWGVGFVTADTIARNLGLAYDALPRLQAGLRYALQKSRESQGHCFLPLGDLLDRARTLLELPESVDLTESLNSLIDQGDIVSRENRIFLSRLDHAESRVAGFIASRLEVLERTHLAEAEVDKAIAQAEADLRISFAPEQRDAVHLAVKYPLLTITGGPGCGKTTIIKALCSVFARAQKVVRLAAPTGRAAQRMAEVCGTPASTIHRLLRYNPLTHSFFHNQKDPIHGDVLIVDEASMIDIELARDLFAAVAPNTTLILVGDKDQLPSVGPGRVLGDLLSVKEIRSVSLSRLFRRSEGSSINEIAHLINCGQIPPIPEPDGTTKSDAYFLNRSEAEEASSLIEKLLSDQIPKKFGFQGDQIVVLTPSNRGPLGAIALNKRLQEVLNPMRDPEQELSFGEIKFRTGDRVCQRKNNYNIHEAGVFNGDLGRIQNIDRHSGVMQVELWDGRLIDYDRTDAAELSLAYAMTVHRAQGAEFPCVLLALHDSHYTLLERQLLYTAATRAKNLLLLVGSKRALAIGCRRTNTAKRCTMVRERIQAFIEGSAVLSS